MRSLSSRSIPALFIESPDAREHLDEITKGLRERFSLSVIHLAYQVHSDAILENESGEGDGIVISRRGTGAIIRTADCFPVIVSDLQVPIAGIFHCGWRGVVLRLVTKGVRFLRERGARSLRATIFPGIGKCCFTIGKDIRERFRESGIPIEERGGHLFGDLVTAIVNQLAAEDVTDVEVLAQCTACTPGLFSHRRDRDGRRHATLVWIPTKETLCR